VTTHVLNSHERLIMGLERWKKYANRRRIGHIQPSLFTPRRFFDFRPEDTNILPDEKQRWREFYDELRERSGTSRVLWGDKFPSYYRFYHQLAEQLPGVRFVFMVREFDPVASSFQVRADNPNDRWSKSAEDAVERWNESLRMTADYLETAGHAPLFILPYEPFFEGVPGYAHRLLRFLGLEKSRAFVKRYRRARKRHSVLCRERRLVVSEEKLADLRERADLELAARLRARPPELR